MKSSVAATCSGCMSMRHVLEQWRGTAGEGLNKAEWNKYHILRGIFLSNREGGGGAALLSFLLLSFSSRPHSSYNMWDVRKGAAGSKGRRVWALLRFQFHGQNSAMLGCNLTWFNKYPQKCPKGALNLWFLLSTIAQIQQPQLLSLLDPSGGWSVWANDWYCDSHQSGQALIGWRKSLYNMKLWESPVLVRYLLHYCIAIWTRILNLTKAQALRGRCSGATWCQRMEDALNLRVGSGLNQF